MIDTSDVIFFLLGLAVGGGVMRWLAWLWYGDLFNPSSAGYESESAPKEPATCKHEWQVADDIPVIDTEPEVVTFRCRKCGKLTPKEPIGGE